MEAVKKAAQTLHIGGEDVPREPSADQLQELKDKYTKAKQEHVFAFYDKLDTPGKAALYEQLASFDPEYINTITDRALRALNPPQSKDVKQDSGLSPLPESATASILDSKPEDIEQWYQ